MVLSAKAESSRVLKEKCKAHWLWLLLFLLYCSKETLFFLLFRNLRWVHNHGLRVIPKIRIKTNILWDASRVLRQDFKYYWLILWCAIHLKLCKYIYSQVWNIYTVMLTVRTHQGSKFVWRLEWLAMAALSADTGGTLLWAALSWKELSGRGEGTRVYI